MNEPLITVVIPCFNHGRFVAEALASVRDQTWPAWEVVVIDDGSTDDSAARIEALLRELGDPRARLLRQDNRGLPSARNAGIAAGSGEFFVPLDADDRLRPRMLEACVAPLLRQPGLGFAYGHMQTFGEAERVVRYPPYNMHRLLDENQVTVSAVVRTAAWRAVGGYKAAMVHGAEDWEFWISCAECGWHGVRVDELVFEYRRQGPSMWTQTARKLDLIRAQIAELHPELYSTTGRARVRAEWHSRFDPHAKDSWYARAAGLLPTPLRRAAETLYRRYWL
ncbi:MAG: glycosyltransferase family A protein [Planctomycetota bacterium]